MSAMALADLETALVTLDRDCAALDEFEVAKERALEQLRGKVRSQVTALVRERESLVRTYDERISAREAECLKDVEKARRLEENIRQRRDKTRRGTLDSLTEPLVNWTLEKMSIDPKTSSSPLTVLEIMDNYTAKIAASLETYDKGHEGSVDILKGGALASFMLFVAFKVLFKVPVLTAIAFPVLFPGVALFYYWLYLLCPAYHRKIIAQCGYRGHRWLKQVEERAREAAEQASADLRKERDAKIQQLEAQELADRESLEAQATAELERLLDEREAALAAKQAELDGIARDLDRRAIALEQEPSLASWSSHSWTAWTPSTEAAPAVRIGRKSLDLPRLRQNFPDLAELPLPALWSPAGDRPLLYSAGAGGSAAALGLLVRLLAALPPGSVRFTVADPARLGQSVAPLLPLLDLAPELLGGKVLSDPQDIEKALAELMEHIERVIQKCLRHEFADLAEYNAQAGEVAEPYRVLAVWDFPTGWTEASLRRLTAILRNGPRCGVQTILVANREAALPHGFTWEELLNLLQAV